MESWKPVPGYEGRYLVSDLGGVISLINNRGNLRSQPFKLSPSDSFGYKQVTLRKDGMSTCWFIHQLVAAAFIGPCPEGMEVNHIDGVKTNNRVDNLEYLTHQDNMQHSYDVLGRVSIAWNKGMKMPGSRPSLSLSQSKRDSVADMIREHKSYSEIARSLKVSRKIISRIKQELGD